MLGVVHESRGLALLLLVITLPALANTSGRSIASRAEGRPMTDLQEAGVFLKTVFGTLGCLAAVAGVLALSLYIAIRLICGPNLLH